MTLHELREALEGMVWQFGYRGVKSGRPIIWTGGLSALEEAFEASTGMTLITCQRKILHAR